MGEKADVLIMTPDDEAELSSLRVEVAKLRTLKFIDGAKHEMLNRMESALYRISNIRPMYVWRAPQIAADALGIGPYWCREYKDHWWPRTLVSYYINSFLRWMKTGFRGPHGPYPYDRK